MKSDAEILAEYQALDDAYARSDAWHRLQNELRKEFDNMRFGVYPVICEDEWQDWERDLRHAALDHRGLP